MKGREENDNSQNKNEKRVSQNLNYNNVSKKREILVNKSKDFFKNRKSISMRYINQDNKKIKININNNININGNINGIIKGRESYNNYHIKRKILESEGISGDGLEKEKSKSNLIDRNSKNESNNNSKNENNSISKNKNKEINSSKKMDKMLLKQLKFDSRDEKQEEFLEFYINNNKKNKLYYYLKNNTISTTKYNIFTFIPKGLLYQFSRLSNVYFLFTAIIQSIPLISPLTSLTAIIPLIFVLGVSMIREAIEDLSRNSYDNLSNEEEVIVFRDHQFIKSVSKTLRSGEIILIYENHTIPADMILIDTGFGEGTCYIETSSLDGEKTLKLKVANIHTQGFISDDIRSSKAIEKFIQPGRYTFNGFVKINAPNPNLNYINGSLYTLFNKDNVKIEHKANISINEFVLKGSVLKNTNWILGIVVYTGMNNKIILNSKKPRLKMSKVERKLNIFLIYVFMFLMICCGECSIFHHFHYKTNKKFYDNFLFLKNSPKIESFIIFFTYFLLLNTLIPISLIVSTEIIKTILAIFMRWDVLLYSKRRKCFCSPKSVSIIEELGNVNFIFSDKTGTLTKNQLEFKYCIIENKYYEYIKIGKKKNTNINNTNKIQKKGSTNIYQIMKGKNKLKGKKNSFLSENNQLLKNNVINYNINDEQRHYKKNSYYKTENMNMPFVYKKLSIQNLINKNDNIINLKSVSNSPESHKSPKSPTSKKEKVIVDKSNETSNDISKRKNKSRNNISALSNTNSNNVNSERTSSSNNSYSNSINISNNSKNNNNENSLFNINNININNKIENILKKQGNSTIIESKNEENDSIPYELIQFSEGYFNEPLNNPYLTNISFNYLNNIFNYIHEFWIALALTNECIVKYEKEEIKYMGTSPDDLELIKAASLQGYKLTETSIDIKTIRINGKDYSYEILKVLGFSSERKRMSIIVKDRNGIKLYSKGADSEITKRLSNRSLQSENYEIISKGLKEFSKKGLRTLMVAYKEINDDDYFSWVNRLYDDELNGHNKQKLIEKLYDIIETDLNLIGCTVVEDKLQDNVPETIKELRSAGIKIWVLTGDKLDTAESIGYSCNLLSKEQRLFSLKFSSEFKEEDFFISINRFFIEFQEYINELVKKYNLDSKYCKIKNNSISHNSNQYDINSEQSSNKNNEKKSQIDNFSNNSNVSSYSKLIDFEIFKDLKEKNFLEPYSIILESPILSEIFVDEEITHNFLRIAYNSNTVICCRTSPSQKSEIIQKIKKFDVKAVTLAIGDGGNDVSMIMEANIGIGLYGEEGMSAVQASDFAIGEFQILKRLLFIHGRINLYRIGEMILYFFFKNFIFTMSQFYFSFMCLASGQTIIDDWYITCYNLVFTAFPLCVKAITDTDIDLNDTKNIKKNLAILYKENRDNYKIFTSRHFAWKLFKGMIISLFIFISCSVNEILIKGYNKNIWYLSLKSYICILLTVSTNILINSHFIAYFLPLTIAVTTFLLFLIFLILNHYGLLFIFNSKASIWNSLSSPLTYLSIIFIFGFDFIIDYSTRLTKLCLQKSLSNKILLKDYFKKREKSCSSSSKINSSSKSNSKLSKDKIKNSISNDEKSKSYLMSNSFNKLEEINKIQKNSFLSNFVPNNYNNSKLKMGDSYKNDFYSLKILKNINNKHNNNNCINNYYI